jgi:hypothetical protein
MMGPSGMKKFHGHEEEKIAGVEDITAVCHPTELDSLDCPTLPRCHPARKFSTQLHCDDVCDHDFVD